MMGKLVEVLRLPDCDFCMHPSGGLKIVPAYYDFRTKNGQWANGCHDHWLTHRLHEELGTGMGQELKLIAAPPPLRLVE